MSQFWSYYKSHKLNKIKQAEAKHQPDVEKPSAPPQEQNTNKKEATKNPKTTVKEIDNSYHTQQKTKFYLIIGAIFIISAGFLLSFLSTQYISKEFTQIFRFSSLIIPVLVIIMILTWNRPLLYIGATFYLFESTLFFIQGFGLLAQSDVSKAKDLYFSNPQDFMTKHNCQCWSKDATMNCNISSEVHTCESTVQFYLLESFLQLAVGFTIIMNCFYLCITGCTLNKQTKTIIDEDLSSQIDSGASVASESGV